MAFVSVFEDVEAVFHMQLRFLGFAVELGATRPLIVLLGMAFACLVAVTGWLLMFRPDLFLKLYDRLNPGDYVGRSGSWRKDVHNAEYKVLGVLFLLSGLLFLGLLAKALLGSG
jgi:hypothetical protein